MPELPEVETMRRGIAAVAGSTIVSAARTPCAKRPIRVTPRVDALNRRVVGQKIESVDRLGKRVVLRLGAGDRIIFEPRMTGLVLIADPPTIEHLRFRIDLTHCPVKKLLFWDRRGLGNVTLLSGPQYAAKLSDGTLGPDALDIAADQFADRFRQSRREVKVALLDQSAVAGIGNLYASEILFLAGVHPRARCNRLTRKQWSRIYKQMVDVLNVAIKYEGSTLADGTYRNALSDPGGYQNQHRVYDKAGQPCPGCDFGVVERIVQAQRSTFFCRKCQTRRS